MTVVLEAEAAPLAPALPQAARHDDAAETREDIIAAHRAALVALAPHQAWRSVREDTAWHITELGLLLGVRDRSPFGVRPAVEPMGCAKAAPPNTECQTPNAEEKAPPSMVPDREGPRESTGTDRLTH